MSTLTDDQRKTIVDLLSNPKHRDTRLATLKSFVAKGKESNSAFRFNMKILNLLIKTGIDSPAEYDAVLKEAEKRFEEKVRELSKDSNGRYSTVRKLSKEAATRTRQRVKYLRGIYKLTHKEAPTKEELADYVKTCQLLWNKRAAEEMILNPDRNLKEVRRETYDKITEELRIEFERLERLRRLKKDDKLECEDARVVQDVPAEVLPDTDSEGHKEPTVSGS